MGVLDRTKRLSVRLREHEHAAIEEAARLSKQTVAELTREVMVAAAQRRIANSGGDRKGKPA